MRPLKTRGVGAGLTLSWIAILACGEPQPQPRTEQDASRPPRVVLRLGPADFEGVPVSYHGAVAPIGDEARAVVVTPESEPVISLLALAPDDDRKVRGTTVLPEHLRGLPTAAFTLQVQRFPGPVEPELLEKMSRSILSRQIRTGWTLERGPDGNATVVYEHEDPLNTHRYSLHLSVLRPGPVLLRSRPFDAPAGASLELAYGLTTVPGAAGAVRVSFRADLDCDGETRRAVVEDRMDGESGGAGDGWRDVVAQLPERGGSCRLDLSASGPDGGAVLGAVWAVPRIFARPNRDAPGSDYNVVMISLDTLRADHLSGFGYSRPTSPRIDRGLIARGTTFRDVTSTYSRTDVSHMSLFTGLYPEARPESNRLRAHSPVPTLAEWLRSTGRETAAFTEDALVAGVFGFWYGFDRFHERAYRHEERGAPVFEDGIAYLKTHRDRPFFLFLHTYKTHVPYYASPPYQDLFRDPSDWEHPAMAAIPEEHRHLADEYDRTVREADDLVGRLLDEIESLGLAERTLVVLLSDHGESFGEHGVIGHSYSGHQEVLRVPVVLRGPGVPAGLAVETPVSLVDLVPSLLEYVGLPAPEATQGISLLPALRGESLPAERRIHFSWLAKEAIGVRYGAFKYQKTKGYRRLYNLAEDPGERAPVDRRATHPIAERLLADYLSESAELRNGFAKRTKRVEAARTTVSPEMEESLRALGYIE